LLSRTGVIAPLDESRPSQKSTWLAAGRVADRAGPTAGNGCGPRETASLDLGCGKAHKNPFQAQSVSGVDLRAVAPPGLRELRSADLVTDAIADPDRSFDSITAFDCIEHIPRLIYAPSRRDAFVELMNEVHRCLKPGGLFLSRTPAYPHKQAFQDPTHVNIITEDTFPFYFDDTRRWGRMYGFTGTFRIVHQSWKDEGTLLSILRALPAESASSWPQGGVAEPFVGTVGWDASRLRSSADPVQPEARRCMFSRRKLSESRLRVQRSSKARSGLTS